MTGTCSDGMFSDGMFDDGMFSDGTFSDGTFSDGTFCMESKIFVFNPKNGYKSKILGSDTKI